MKELGFKLVGIVPLLMHSNRAANPMNEYAQFIKSLAAKKDKTIEDYKELGRIEWEAGLYLHEGMIVLPAENLDRCLWDSSKKTKKGKQYKAGAMITEDWLPLEYRGPKIALKKQNGDLPIAELDKYYDHFKHQGMVKVSGKQILRTRPIFHEWSLVFHIMIDEQVLDDRSIFGIVETAGKYVGLGEKRPRLGRFNVERI